MQRWNPSKAIGFRGVLTFMKYILYLFSSLCYNDTVAPPILAQEGGVSYGRFFHHFYYLCYGRCGLPPHLQMAGQEEVKGNQPRA